MDCRTEKDRIREILGDGEYHTVREILKALNLDKHDAYRMLRQMWLMRELKKKRAKIDNRGPFLLFYAIKNEVHINRERTGCL